jgi:hypothetical protein
LNRRDDPALDELLSGGNSLGGPTYDRTLESVLARTTVLSPSETRRRRWLYAAPVAAVAALGAIVLWVRPQADGFRSRGGGAGVAQVDVGCARAETRVCRPGDTLMFKVSGEHGPGYLFAFAVREGDPRGERIWYFPTAAGDTPQLSASDASSVLAQGVRLGPEHPVGTYRVTVGIVPRQIRRSEVDALPESARGQVTFRVRDDR